MPPAKAGFADFLDEIMGPNKYLERNGDFTSRLYPDLLPRFFKIEIFS
jgi:hypothetical protein